MRHVFYPGQKFTMTNPDWNIFEEVWTVVAVTYPTLQFSCWKRWHVDREYMLPTSTTPFAGKVVYEGDSGAILVDAHHTGHREGYRLKGEQITFI